MKFFGDENRGSLYFNIWKVEDVTSYEMIGGETRVSLYFRIRKVEEVTSYEMIGVKLEEASISGSGK